MAQALELGVCFAHFSLCDRTGDLRAMVGHSGRVSWFKSTQMKIIHKYNLFSKFEFVCLPYNKKQYLDTLHKLKKRENTFRCTIMTLIYSSEVSTLQIAKIQIFLSVICTMRFVNSNYHILTQVSKIGHFQMMIYLSQSSSLSSFTCFRKNQNVKYCPFLVGLWLKKRSVGCFSFCFNLFWRNIMLPNEMLYMFRFHCILYSYEISTNLTRIYFKLVLFNCNTDAFNKSVLMLICAMEVLTLKTTVKVIQTGLLIQDR